MTHGLLEVEYNLPGFGIASEKTVEQQIASAKMEMVKRIVAMKVVVHFGFR